jgi:hypothetical protein
MTADEIYKRSEHLIDKRFMDTRDGKIYSYIGVLIQPDDYWYALYDKDHGLIQLSCALPLDSYSFDLVENQS